MRCNTTLYRDVKIPLQLFKVGGFYEVVDMTTGTTLYASIDKHKAHKALIRHQNKTHRGLTLKGG